MYKLHGIAPLFTLSLALTFGATDAQAQAFSFSLLHTFDTEDACDTSAVPEPGTPVYSGILAQGTDGAMYSSSSAGGTCHAAQGAAYRVTTTGLVQVKHGFGMGDGLLPNSGLTLASDGNFYGTTKSGGSFNLGSVFMMTPAGAVTIVHSFNGTDGGFPTAPPIQGLDGNFYGTTAQGGNYEGVVYRMAPTSPWKLTSFPFPFNLTSPDAPLVQANDGFFYGTAQGGGVHGHGGVFRMSSGGSISIVYSFDGVNGAAPVGPLIQGSDGNLYGTASAGGDANGDGVVFRLTRSGSITPIHLFNSADGKTPLGGLVQASNGSFYGVASAGGGGDGTLYRVKPQGTSFVFSPLFTFGKLTTGQIPQLTLLQHTNGLLYGDTSNGGTTIEEGGNTHSGGQGTFYAVNDTGLIPFVKTIPAGAGVGTTITIFGQGFTAASKVSFNGGAATLLSQSSTSLTVHVPTTAVTGIVSVTTSTTVLKTLKPFLVFPAIAGFTPTSGKVGSQVVIHGTGLSGTTLVSIGNVKATVFTVNAPTQVTAMAPTGAKTGKIALTTAGGSTTSSGTFTVLP